MAPSFRLRSAVLAHASNFCATSISGAAPPAMRACTVTWDGRHMLSPWCHGSSWGAFLVENMDPKRFADIWFAKPAVLNLLSESDNKFSTTGLSKACLLAGKSEVNMTGWLDDKRPKKFLTTTTPTLSLWEFTQSHVDPCDSTYPRMLDHKMPSNKYGLLTTEQNQHKGQPGSVSPRSDASEHNVSVVGHCWSEWEISKRPKKLVGEHPNWQWKTGCVRRPHAPLWAFPNKWLWVNINKPTHGG